jgi:hypothetical protein
MFDEMLRELTVEGCYSSGLLVAATKPHGAGCRTRFIVQRNAPEKRLSASDNVLQKV